MIKIRWIVTDDIKDVDLKEFNTEWNGICGYFEISINKQKLGYCPDRELLAGEEADENILYWLSELSDGIIRLNDGQEYEIFLLCMNRVKLVLGTNNKSVINLVWSETNEVIWSEEIVIQEFCRELILSIKRFLAEIQEHNSVLLQADLVKELIKLGDMLVSLL